MKTVLVCFCIFFSINKSNAQVGIKTCKDTIEANVLLYHPSEPSNLIKDSLVKIVRLVFEQKFDDTISIFVDDSLLNTGYFKTMKNLGVCANTVSIDFSASQKIPKISIVLHSSIDCISFYPRIDKRIAYITRIDRAWSVDLSNVIRDYK